MAAQNNIAISQPQFAAETVAITLVSEKEKKKQQQELAHLATILKALEEEMAGAKAGANGKAAVGKSAVKGDGKIVDLDPASGTPQSSNTAFEDAMAEMTLMLQMLQVKIVKYGQQKTTYDATVSKAQVELAQTNLNKTLAQIQKMETMSFWEKIAEWFVALVSAVVAVVTMNPELLAITVISVLAATGALSEITKGLADLIEMCPGESGGHASKEVANLIASIIVTLAVIVCSFGMGAIAAPEAAADGAAEAVTEESTEAAAQAVEAGASDSSTVMQKVGAFLKKINLFNRLSPATNSAILGAAQAISSTGLFTNIVEATNNTRKDKERIEEILSIIVAVLATVVSLGSSAGAMENSAKDITQSLVKNSSRLFQLGGFAQFAGQLAGAGVNIAQGFGERDLSDIKADMALIQSALQMSTDQTSEDQKNLASVIKGQGIGNQSITKIMEGEAAFAQLLTANSPV